MENVTFRLNIFEGPLDLLLHLIAKNKVDIRDVPISDILAQYMEYLSFMQEMNLEVASEFITMAAQLMYIKSKMLLPVEKDSEEEDPRAHLVEILLDYQRFKELSNGYFHERADLSRDLFIKEPEPIERKKGYEGVHNTDQLLNALLALVARSGRKLPPPIDSFTGIVGKEEAPVEKRVFELLKLFEKQKQIRFLHFISMSKSRSEMIAGFLAILELSKTHRITINDDNEDYLIELSAE
ncbi:MAG: segregation/condensation protein A [Clostridiales bacterium]|nr:segregation/condensation protein A [Clostridiales bacterium]